MGTTRQILEKAGEKTLEEAFIALLPEEKRAHHQKVVVRPLWVKSRHTQCKRAFPLWVNSGYRLLFDHFVGDLLTLARHIQAERLGGLEVDDQLELGCWHG